MVMKMLGRLFGTKNSREINRLKKISDRVNGFEPKFEAYSDLELKAVRAEFVNRLSAGETLKALLPEAFAVVREAGKRALGMRIFDVQMVGAVALHEGCLLYTSPSPRDRG